MGEVIDLVQPPTVQERYEHFRENAEIFVSSMQTMIAALERDGKDEEATHLRVWALMPWEAALRDDGTGQLWFTCEVCEKPIKGEADRVASDDGCWFHRVCLA